MYAPVWEIELQGDDDRIGTPIWTDKGVLDVDTRKPLTYTLLSFTRFGKQILAQLNYIIWFPSRPKQNAWDLYGGLLDGVNLRVTLDGDGAPLLYETIHNCGCYYKAYPTKRLKVRAEIDYAEPPLILEAPDSDAIKNFVTVAMESRTHYVQHLYPLSRELPTKAAAYSLADYGHLRSLPMPVRIAGACSINMALLPAVKGWSGLFFGLRVSFRQGACASGVVMQWLSSADATSTIRIIWIRCLWQPVPATEIPYPKSK